MPSLLFVVFRRSRQRNRKRRLSRSAESGERAKPGGHGGRGLDAAGPEASKGGLIFLLGQPSWEPQKEKEQEQTQVHNRHLHQRAVYRISFRINKGFLMLIVFLRLSHIWVPGYLVKNIVFAGKLVSCCYLGNWRRCWLRRNINLITQLCYAHPNKTKNPTHQSKECKLKFPLFF